MIQIGIDYRAKDVITVDAKSYVMLGHDGKMTIKGQTMKGRTIEPIFKDMKEIMCQFIFDGDYDSCVEYYQDLKERIECNLVLPEEVSQRSQLNMTLKEYTNKRDTKATKVSAVYELALSRPDQRFDRGDIIRYYVRDPGTETVTVRGKEVTRQKKVTKAESAAFIDEYDYDIDVVHYTSRLDEQIMFLYLVFGHEKFVALFPKVKIYKKHKDKILKREAKIETLTFLYEE